MFASNSLQNPLIPAADPFVFFHRGSYYLSGTHSKHSLELWHAPRLEQIATSRTTIWTPGPGEPAHQIWSPSFFLLPYQGTRHWFVYFTASMDDTNEGHRIYVLQSQGEDPLGPYSFQGQLRGTDETAAIGASVLRIEDQYYMVYVLTGKANVISIAPLSDPSTVSGPPRPLVEPDQPWEQGADSGQSSYPVAEGPEALYHDGKTFLIYSGSDTGNFNYCLGMLIYSGGNPLERNSWAKRGPVFQFSQANGVFGPGRATFTTSPDGKQPWMVYHAKTSSDYTYAGRSTRAQPFSWNADGTPHFGEPVSLQAILAAPSDYP